MTPQHLTLLLLLPAFVLGMFLQYQIEARHRRRREAHRAALHSLPRTSRPESCVPPPFPLLPNGVGLFMHVWDCDQPIGQDLPIWRAEFSDSRDRLITAFVHAPTTEAATDLVLKKVAIGAFKLTAPTAAGHPADIRHPQS